MTFSTVSMSKAKLAQSLEAGFWSPDLCPAGRQIARSTRAASRVRLSPLGVTSPATPTAARGEVCEQFPSSPMRRTPSAGHVGTLWGLRHSAPTAPQSRMSELLASPSSSLLSLSASECSGSERRVPQDIRNRRIRRPADFGASSSGCARSRGHSCAGTVGEAKYTPCDDAEVAEATSVSSSSSVRGCSTPPTGTDKADGAAAAAAKARAVSALQRLFFEEMSKNGGDASGAAALALRRLSEAPSTPAASSVVPLYGEVPASSAAAFASSAASHADDEEAPDAEEEAPARQLGPGCQAECFSSQAVAPSRPDVSVEGRRRRPCPAACIKVGA